MEQQIEVIKTEQDLTDENYFIEQETDVPEYVSLNSALPELKPNLNNTEQIFKCPQCNIKYKKLDFLVVHLAAHDPSMCCRYCSEQFSCSKKFRMHIHMHVRLKINADKRVTYECSYCLKTFTNKKTYRVHLRVHTNERPYKCEVCGEAFKQTGALKDHLVTHTKEKRYICEICQGSYTTASSMRRHKRKIHERNRTINCKQCGAKFQNKADFTDHQKTSHPFGGYRRTCPGCSEEFRSKRLFRAHKEAHSTHFPRPRRVKPSYMCNWCGEEVCGLKAFWKHKRSHISYAEEEFKEAARRKSIPCKFCPMVYTTKQSLYRHMDHHLDKKVKCDLCDSLLTRSTLRSHKKGVHQIMDCRVCHEVIAGTSRLYYHYRKMHNEYISSKYQCNVCGKKFVMNNTLQAHILSKHQVGFIKNFKCSFCGRRFVTRHFLQKHRQKVHNVQVKLKCKYCDLTFKSRREQNAHKRTHSDRIEVKKSVRKRFRCKACKKIFRNSNNYQNHLSLKTCVNFLTERRGLCDSELESKIKKEELYDSDNKCKFCDKIFKSIDLIHRHILKCHSEVPIFECDSCGQVFDAFLEFQIHCNSHMIKREVVEQEVSCLDSRNIANCDVVEAEVKKEFVEKIEYLST